ncbi:MAG: MarR family winged helix-turn-helix transcriptional regulator [Dehalococcoidia bacterium]
MTDAAAALPPFALDVDHAPSALIRRLSRRLRYRLDARLERYGLTSVQWGVLANLGHADGQSQVWLQQRLAIEAATLTPMVQRLERDGWIRRESDRADRRRQQVWLTAQSRDLLTVIAAEVEQYRQESLRGFSDDEIALLSALLDRMEANLL